MAKNLSEKIIRNFSTGLNTEDSSHEFADTDLSEANNVVYTTSGEVRSLNGLTKIGNSIKVNGLPCTKVLGRVKFNSTDYLLASNGTESRFVKRATREKNIGAFTQISPGVVQVDCVAHGLYENDFISILIRTSGLNNIVGDYYIYNVHTDYFFISATYSGGSNCKLSVIEYAEVASTNFSPTLVPSLEVYNNKIWFVNGETIGGNILHFISTSDILTGLSTSSGLVEGINRICLHQERIWISKGNSVYVSIQYPIGTNDDWDGSQVYSGSNAPGIIQLDNNTNDSIKNMKSFYGTLVIFREFRIHVVIGETILTSTIQKSFNSKGVLADFSITLADSSIYFLAHEGIKAFKGVTTQDKNAEFDSVSSISMDVKIKSLINEIENKSSVIAHAFKDKLYVSDGVGNLFIYDEITSGWSKSDLAYASVIFDDSGILYMSSGDSIYSWDTDLYGDVSANIRTKDFNLGTDQLFKIIEKVLCLFKRVRTNSDIIFEWYIDGANEPNGSITISVPGKTIIWDDGYNWDDAIEWDMVSINFYQKGKRRLPNCMTIAFGVRTTLNNRFSLNGFNILYELSRREI